MAKQQHQAFDFNKFSSAVLYFLGNADAVGVTKLMKMLYFMDFDFYEEHGRSLTGARYVAIDHGPVVDGYKTLMSSMEEEGWVTSQIDASGLHALKTLRPLYDWNAEDFSTEAERMQVRSTADRFKGNTAKDLEAASHCDAPWILTWKGGRGRGTVIPYALVSRRGEDIDALEHEAERFDPLDELISAYHAIRR